jgi:valyl-tRNA synthetase
VGGGAASTCRGWFAPTASVQAEGVTVQLDTAAAIDIGAERRRLEKDLSAAQADAAATERKLATP